MTTHWRNRAMYRPVRRPPWQRRLFWTGFAAGIFVVVAVLAGCQTAEGLLRTRHLAELDVACRDANLAREDLIAAMEAVEPGSVPEDQVDAAEDASAVALLRCSGVDEDTPADDLEARTTLVEDAARDMRAIAEEIQP